MILYIFIDILRNNQIVPCTKEEYDYKSLLLYEQEGEAKPMTMKTASKLTDKILLKRKGETQKQMTEAFSRYGVHEVDHTQFGGIIYPSDFYTECRGKINTNGSSRAHRIVSDWEFDRKCKINRENTIKMKRGK